MKKSISSKLFLITSVFLLLFMIVTMFFQTAFFGNFYTARKTETFEQNVKKFNTFYSNNFVTKSSLDIMLFQFEETNNAKLIIFDKDGNITVSGNFNAESDKTKINTIAKVFNNLANSSDLLNSITESQNTVVENYYDKQFNVQNIVCISPVVIDGSGAEIILAVSSLQPIEEASNVIQEFYKFIFLGALIIALILSFIFSHMISKPLIKLNNSARKIAQLDFSPSYIVNTDDELGSLSKTLGFLSQKLNNTLIELQDSNEKLKQDIERERYIDSMRKNFIAGVSHELKTPISLISGYAEGLKDNIAEGESKEFYIDVILDEANKMNNLVSDMLDLSQLESGNFKLKYDTFSLSQLTEKVIKKHITFIDEKSIKIITNFDQITNVLGDKTRIEQVITNFITNALRYTPKSGLIKISISPENGFLYFKIENNGDSMHPDDLKNIWDKFYKIDKSRSRVSGGTGLGLSIVKNILLLHESSFGVKNTEDGILFYFSLKKSV